MNKFPITVILVSLCFIFGGCIGIVIGRAATRPLICHIYTCKNGVCGQFKTHCLRVGSDVRYGGEVASETPTEIVYPTATDTPFDPYATATFYYATLTPTKTATPPFITHTPEPYIPPEETREPYP
jgi:hypothetical protein